MKGEVICACLVTIRDGIMQYHLTGTRGDSVQRSPFKLLVDESRSWAHARGVRVAHLGGGVGGREDSLFNYKAGFSPRRHDFQVWQWIVDPEVYTRLCAARMRHDAQRGWGPGASGYFPSYRAYAAPPGTVS